MIFINKKFYLCGGVSIFGKDNFDKGNDWRIDLKKQIENISDNHIKCCNPNDHYNFLDSSSYKSQREIMEYDLYKVRNSDLLIVNFNDPGSIGSACELAVAYDRRIPIIGLCEDKNEDMIHPWLKEFCTRIFDDREDLILFVIRHYINDD